MTLPAGFHQNLLAMAIRRHKHGQGNLARRAILRVRHDASTP
jgi:hypothetical protein